jgi:site-specific recombinase XerD
MTPVSEAIETYLYAIAALSSETQRLYRRSLTLFQEYCESHNIALEQITPKVFRAYVEHLTQRISFKTKKPLDSETVHGYASAVKVFLTWVTEYDDYVGTIKPGSLKAMRVPKSEKKIMPVFTVEEIKRLEAACKKGVQQFTIDRDRALLSILLDTGLRASELTSLTLENVRLQEMRITVHGKGRKQRELNLGTKARLDLHRYISRHRRGAAPDAYVFLSYKRNRLSQVTLDMILERLKGLARIDKKGGAHMFRRTFATLYMENGGDIYDLRDIMGHEFISTTEKYVANVKKRKAKERSKSVLDNL